MKISCPDCQASYDADLPDLTEEGVEVKCAECQHSFLVTPEASPVRSSGSSLPDSSEDHEPEDQDNLDDMLDQLIDEENENDSAEETTDDSAGPELDSMLDDLISGDTQTSVEETTDDSAEPELDSMLDDLISGDTETSTVEGPEETPLDLSDGEESELDTMADDATDDKTVPDSLETEEDITSDDDDDLDGLLDDILNDEDEETDETASTEGEAEAPETEASVDDILGDLLPKSETEESAAEPEEEEEADTEPEATEEPVEETTKTEEVPSSTEDPLEEMNEEDMWAEAFADQETTEETAKETTEEATEEAAEDGGGKSEEDMWAEAFADQETTEETAKEDEGAEGDEDAKEDEDAEEDEQDAAAELGLSEDDYPEDDDDDYEEEGEEESRIKIGPISVPDTRTGKLMLAGGVLGLLVTVGGAYFAWQTFAPSELTEVAKPESKVPEGLTPKPDKEQAPAAQEETSGKAETQPEQAGKPARPEVLGEVGEDTKSEVAQELAKSQTLSDSSESIEVVTEDSEGLEAALSPGAKMVKFSTIMPVAFDVNDIRVLSFTLEITFTDEASAQVMQSALPFFEEATVKAVEKFLAKKFYNDILYVKEKLEKRLQTAYNDKIDSAGRVKKIKFEDFVIQ